MLSEVYKKERQSSKTGGCLSFFVVVTDKGKSTPQGVKKKRAAPRKNDNSPVRKNAAPREKSVDIHGKIWYDILGEI